MPALPGAVETAIQPQENSERYGKPLMLLARLFFMWGFITAINNTLLPHLHSVFDLDYTHTTLIESVWFITSATASMPSYIPDRARRSQEGDHHRAFDYGDRCAGHSTTSVR